MANTATVTLHPVWSCRWSTRAADDHWLCSIEGHARVIDADECASCLFWEQAAERSQRVAAVHPEPLRIAVRSVLVLAAILLVATGAWILTGPAMVPFTIALWLGAAGLIGLATFAPLSTE